MTKIRHIRSKRGFTQISNVVFDDWRLSYKEIGLYCNMLKFPDDWEFSVRNLSTRHKDKKSSIKTALDSLIRYGYIARGNQFRDEKGFFCSYDYVIYDDPYDNPDFIPCPEKENKAEPNCGFLAEDGRHSDYRFTENRKTDNRLAEKPHTTNTVAKNTVVNKTFEEEGV